MEVPLQENMLTESWILKPTNGYLKLDGSNQMSANLRMNGKRIVGLTNVPAYDGEATNKKYVDVELNTKANKNDLNGYLKLDGTSQM